MADYCDACGPAQSSHLGLWMTSVSDMLMRLLPPIPFADTDMLERVFAQVGVPLGFASFSTDTSTAISQRSQLLWVEALRRGIGMEQLMIGGPTDIFRIQKSGRTEFFKSLPPLRVSDRALRMDDKIHFKEAMRKAGIPVPQSRSVRKVKDALDALAEFGMVCVKPRTGSNGRHTFPFVRTADDVVHALESVLKVAPFASIEEHLEGNLCRATCIGGTLYGFLESEHPQIVGDGVSTIEECIAARNGMRAHGTEALVLDAAMTGYIRRRGFAVTDILPQGIKLQLTYRGGRSVGATNREYGRAIHPSFIAVIERAAAATALPIVGFDLIIPDPLAPADIQRFGFIEANSLPWVDLHATPYHGELNDLAPRVWDLWETLKE